MNWRSSERKKGGASSLLLLLAFFLNGQMGLGLNPGAGNSIHASTGLAGI